MDGHGASSILCLKHSKPDILKTCAVWNCIFHRGQTEHHIQVVTAAVFVTYTQERQQDELIDGKQRDLEQSHGQQLDWTGFTQNCSKRDEHRTSAEISIDHAVENKQTNKTILM